MSGYTIAVLHFHPVESHTTLVNLLGKTITLMHRGCDSDLAVMARPHLADPYLTAHAGVRYDWPDYPWPDQYLRGRPRSGG